MNSKHSMKQCPQCKTTYTDESLRFCLTDGTALAAVADEQPTVVSQRRRDKMQVDIPFDDPTRSSQPSPQSKGSTGRWSRIILGIFLLGLLGILITGAAGFIIYYSLCCSEANTEVKPTLTPPISPTPTPDDEKTKLQEELANLQKKLEEQKKANANIQTFPTPELTFVRTARVNTPNDGFLALRDEPHSEYGERIAKIPHGTVLVIEDCKPALVTIGSRRGRWCMVNYGGYEGWVFDAWLEY